MSELTEEQRALLVGDDARMEGYYVGFHKTGVDVIDQILSAVAYAAKGAHKTEAWSHELEYDYGPVPADKTFEWLIQEAANDAAERLTAASADDELIEAYNDAVRESMAAVTERDGHASSGSRESIVAGLRAVAGFRRPAQGDYYEGLEEGVTVGRNTVAQTEPTDAQVIAALNAWHQDVMPVNRLGVFGTQKEDLMRAALKAAFTAGQEEQS